MKKYVFRGALHVRYAYAAALMALAFAVTGPAAAQDRRQNTAGSFDFYVLALSWSPTFCAANQERNPDRPPQQPQCGDRPFSFVVHGLWPQYDKGFPEYCQQPSPRLDRNIVSSMLDVMPSPRLVFNQWDKHGTCSGLSPRAYFEMVRKARAIVKIPDAYIDLSAPLMVSPGEVESAFVKANPGMAEEGIAVSCDSRRLTEVRICVSRDLQFRSCHETDRRACRRDRLVMPPVRGG